MQEGIYFPNFWHINQVEHWINHFINSRLSESIHYSKSQPFILPVDWLRQLYISHHNDFIDLVQLFKMFGINVEVQINQGLFTRNNNNQENSFVVDMQNINVEQLVIQHPLLDGLANFQQLLTYDSLFGLALDYLISVNPVISMESLLQLFHEHQIAVKTPVKIDFKTTESPIIKKPISDKHVEKALPSSTRHVTDISVLLADLKNNKAELSIKQLFNKKSYRSLVHALNKSGITTINQLTRNDLEKTARSLKFKNKKLKKILDVFDNNKLSIAPNINSISNHLLSEKVPKLIIESESSISNLKIIKVNQSIFLPLLPIPENMFKNKQLLPLVDYQSQITNYFNSKKQNQHFVHLKEIVDSLQKIPPTSYIEESILPTVDILRRALKIELGIDSDYGLNCDKQVLQYSWFLQEKLVPEQQVNKYIEDFWNTFDNNTQDIVKTKLDKKMDEQVFVEKLGLSENELRSTYRDFMNEFAKWWRAMSLTNKLLVRSRCNTINLNKFFDKYTALVILRTIVASNQDLKNLWKID